MFTDCDVKIRVYYKESTSEWIGQADIKVLDAKNGNYHLGTIEHSAKNKEIARNRIISQLSGDILRYFFEFENPKK